METLTDLRKNSRTDLTWPVSVWLPEANRFINGRSLNISKGGVMVEMPLTAPVRSGHIVEINFPRTMSLARQKGQFARIKSGRVIRVERENRICDGNIGIAVQFV